MNTKHNISQQAVTHQIGLYLGDLIHLAAVVTGLNITNILTTRRIKECTIWSWEGLQETEDIKQNFYYYRFKLLSSKNHTTQNVNGEALIQASQMQGAAAALKPDKSHRGN